MRKFTFVMIIAIFAFGTLALADVRTTEGCSNSTLSVSSAIEVTPHIDTQITVFSTSLYGAAFDPIVSAMHINTDFLVTLATLNVKFNFQNILVYVNVNKSNVISFMGDSDIEINGKTYSHTYDINNVYFVINETLNKTTYGYYTLTINVEALNSQVEQWALGSQYAIPVEFTVLYENLGNLMANYGNI